jgi:sarcosine oxidase delta subunit
MKTRNGFVSNSSSSSFIIAIKQTNVPCPHCGRRDPNFLDMVEKSSDWDDNRIDARETEETLKYIEDNEKGWVEAEEYKKIEDGLSKYKNNKEWNIVDITLSNHDATLRGALDNLVKSGNAEIIWESEG